MALKKAVALVEDEVVCSTGHVGSSVDSLGKFAGELCNGNMLVTGNSVPVEVSGISKM